MFTVYLKFHIEQITVRVESSIVQYRLESGTQNYNQI